MSKEKRLLESFKDNIGQWVCGFCNSGSNQPAATFRSIKKMGYKFEEISPNRWGKNFYCQICSSERTHYKLLFSEPVFEEKERIKITQKDRSRIIKLLDEKDAITGASITSTPEIDHKIPWTRLDRDIDVSKLNDEEILQHFQLLTREHNLLKDRACRSCVINNVRTPFLEIPFWYEGHGDYQGTCVGCGWHDSKKWRECLRDSI